MFEMYIQNKCRYVTDDYNDMINAVHMYFNCDIWVYKNGLVFEIFHR